jgi:hypothetical protein
LTATVPEEEMVLAGLPRRIRTVLFVAGVVLLSALGGVLLGCGDAEDDSGSAQPAETVTQPERGEETDQAGRDDGDDDRDDPDGRDDGDDRDYS